MANVLKKYSVRVIVEDSSKWEYKRVFNAEREAGEIDKMKNLVDKIDAAADAEYSGDYKNSCVYYVYAHEYYEKYKLDMSIAARVDKDLVVSGSSNVDDLFTQMTKIITES